MMKGFPVVFVGNILVVGQGHLFTFILISENEYLRKRRITRNVYNILKLVPYILNVVKSIQCRTVLS